jgi:LysR family glycine cleavage system transcriptional activator
VRTYVTFAAKWLIPRLPDFQREHPQVEVRIATAVPDVDFDRDPVDVAIQFGDGRWPRVKADFLFDDEIEPVCSPRYLAQHLKDRRQPGKLLAGRLLVSHYRKSDWDEWLAAAGLEAAAQGAERMSFSSSVLTWQAAHDGLGLAIGQTAMLGAEFASGELVRPFARPVRTGRGYYLLRTAGQRESRKVAAFRDWLLEACRGAGAGAAGSGA